jgi:hypothetical protein
VQAAGILGSIIIIMAARVAHPERMPRSADRCVGRLRGARDVASRGRVCARRSAIMTPRHARSGGGSGVSSLPASAAMTAAAASAATATVTPTKAAAGSSPILRLRESARARSASAESDGEPYGSGEPEAATAQQRNSARVSTTMRRIHKRALTPIRVRVRAVDGGGGGEATEHGTAPLARARILSF